MDRELPDACPGPERLAALLRGPPPAFEASLVAHLSECPICQARLEALAGGSSWLLDKTKSLAQTTSPNVEPLQRAIRALESSADEVQAQPPLAPRLDFLQPSNQPGVLGKFGSYEVLAHIASGGMGIVLKARDPALDRIVALKILPPALAANGLARARFVREARAAAAVIHEHVVPIYAVDEWAGLPYLVMQFVHGQSLSERIRATGPLHLEEILRIGAQTAAGLAAAHSQGLVHRDVKPGNILLENGVERVKLTDFGLARAADDTGLTRTGELAGTPEFMAPEQAGNETVDHRTDLFSLGTVLYAMSTGRSPFEGTSVIAVVRKVCDSQPPPVHEIIPAVPRWFSDIILRLMAKLPADRFQSAEEVSELLEQYLARVQHGELGELSAMRGTRGRLQRRIVIGVAAVMAVVGVLFFTFKNRRSVTLNSAPPGLLPQSQSEAPLPLQSAFVVRTGTGTTIGGFAEIQAALAASPTGGVIELCWTGSRSMDPISLPAKALTLRAGRGYMPVWNSHDSAVALSANGPLTLEGIHFEMTFRAGRSIAPPNPPNQPRIPPTGLALLSITNGPLRMAHCIVETKGSRPEHAGIILTGVADCRLESTLFSAMAAKAIAWQRPLEGSADPAGQLQLLMSNCCAAAAEILWLDFGPPHRVQLGIDRCTFLGSVTFCFPSSLTSTNLQMDARRNVFNTGAVMVDARHPAATPLSQWLLWREQHNLYRSAHQADQQYIEGAAIRNGPATLEEWNRYWNQSGVNSRQVQLVFAHKGTFDKKPPRFLAAAESYRIVNLSLAEGPPLERDQWHLFGADTSTVGPRSVP